MRIGFIGFGEADFHLAKGLRQPGIASIAAFDSNVTDKVRQRAREAETRLVETNRELAQSCDIMLSAVTADQACMRPNKTRRI
jgi:3-hydroxyisobutyrate dehydrogenase-like beta-hydroxyacid dehydrogenase